MKSVAVKQESSQRIPFQHWLLGFHDGLLMKMYKEFSGESTDLSTHLYLLLFSAATEVRKEFILAHSLRVHRPL